MVGRLTSIEVVLLDLALKVFPVGGVVLPLIPLGRSLPNGLLDRVQIPPKVFSCLGIADVVVKLAHAHGALDDGHFDGLI